MACPKIFGNRLVLLSTKGEYSWALRDFIAGLILRSGQSNLTLSDIEKLTTYSQEPAYRSVDRRMEWTRELEDLSRKKLGSNYDDTTAPNSNLGGWKRL